MSKAIKSDEVNAAIRTMCTNGFQTYGQDKIDQYLKDGDILKQCELGTLCRAMDEYEQAFDEKNWDIFYHVAIKAQQSSVWRKHVTDKKFTFQSAIEPDKTNPIEDPLAILAAKQTGQPAAAGF